jgi:hypothetical protein
MGGFEPFVGYSPPSNLFFFVFFFFALVTTDLMEFWPFGGRGWTINFWLVYTQQLFKSLVWLHGFFKPIVIVMSNYLFITHIINYVQYQ